MTDEKNTMPDMENEDSRIYEASFHLVPNLDEVGLAKAFQDIKSLIESNGGSVIASEMPLSMPLAYSIDKDIDRKRHTFTSAYFGWVVFESNPEGAHTVKQEMQKDVRIVRYLLIKTTKEAAEPRKHPALSSETPHAPEEVVVAPEVAPKAPVEPMTVQDMDAEIAKLVVE